MTESAKVVLVSSAGALARCVESVLPRHESLEQPAREKVLNRDHQTFDQRASNIAKGWLPLGNDGLDLPCDH